ncbi:MAG TPA: hypothetical protein VHM25_11335, partial [Polyangiaceae bacterium]|nr:hypothetical protein [Polyangiaceae bacterium]
GEAGSAATQRRARLELERAQALLRAGKRAGARQIIDDIWPTLYATSPDAAVRAALLTAATGEFGGLDRVKLERLELALGAAVDEGDKIRLQARLAAELWVEPAALARRLHLSDEALAAARKLGDPELVFQVIDDRCQALFGTGRDDERQALAEELRQRAHGVEQGLSASRRAMSVLLQRGEFARFAREVENFSGQSRTLRQSSLEEDALQRLQLVATLQGDLGRALGLIEQTRRLGHEIENPQAEMGYRFTRGWIAQLRGEREVLASIASEFEGDAARLPNLPFIRSYWALCHAAAGQLDAARLQLSRYMGELFPALPHDLARTASLAFATECAVLIDAREALEQLLPCLSRELGPFVSVGSTLCYGALEYFVGIAQLALGNLEAALEALGLADRLHEQSGSPTLQWRSVWALARLEQRTRASRDVSASTLARLHALGKHLAIATPNSEPAPRPADPEPGEQKAELRRQGTGWTLNWSGKLYVLPDAKGVGLLAILLEAPGRRVHVLDLVDAGELKREGQGAPVLDKRALAAYRLRRTELRQIEQDAAGAGDMTAAHAARAEREAIEDALKTALGLGGRARASGSAERARSAVGKALKRALQTVVDVCAEAGAHLTRGVRTGTFCVYDPDPAVRVFWTIQR